MSNDVFEYSGKLAHLYQLCRDKRLVASVLAVASVLIEYANKTTRIAYPSIATIVAESGVPKTTAIRALRRLEECGYLIADRRNGAHSVYTLTSPAHGTGATWNATGATRGLQTGPAHGTEAAPSTEPEQKKAIKQQKKQQEAVTGDAPSLDLPAWLDLEIWQVWKKHRGKDFSAYAQKLCVRKLITLYGEGHDPQKLIELAIESGWSSLNPRDFGTSCTLRDNVVPLTKGAGQVLRDTRTPKDIDEANMQTLTRLGGSYAAG